MKQRVNDPKAAFEYFATKLAFTATPAEVKKSQDQNEKVNLIDVRKKEDYAKGHIPGAVNMPEDEWKSLKALSKDNNNILYSGNGNCHLADKAAYQFAEGGYPVAVLEGGFQSWKDADYAIEGQGFGGNTGGSGNPGDYRRTA